METKRIEDRLKEYRERKEKERLASIRAAKPLYERVLPNVLIAPISKIVEATRRNHTCTDDGLSKEQLAETNEPTATASDSLSSDHDAIEEASKPMLLKQRKNKKSALSPQVAAAPLFGDHPASTEQVHSTESAADSSNFWMVLLVLKIILWVLLFLLAVEFEWGAVFVVLSAFYLILTNLRSDSRKSWEPSAYSVFNPGCQAIDGTLKAEQFEKEIRYGF